ncbi:hypothetical protein GCM10011502_29440 [Oceanisphaera marina]|uniref:DUF2256 domain-containing protein n=1 Tax=Oceanisphaera marina TaxID=2017550 RepID=A0ABQ1IX07_9GAMM|nr:DUF2256 domain-containing protein [Oceanisphaera marina]GGB54483.1 hypothetical protein GCM10011502_29440 [Oceanisphaera marina]
MRPIGLFLPMAVTMINKSDLPFKVCPVCQRPFSWRKKWANNWLQVKYCSKRCAGRRSQAGKTGSAVL